jgi:serine protease Do
VLVVEVDEDGPAAKAAVKAGDVVVKLNGKPVKDGRDLRDGLAGLSAGAEASLGLLRDGKPLELKVKLGGRAERHGGEQM